MLGGTVIAAGLYAGRNVGSVMVVGALATAAMSLLPVVWLLPARGSAGQDMAATGDGPVSLPRRAVLLLGLVAFASFVCEGAAMDWSALYANTVLGADLAGASIAFTTFAVAMTATRFIGDRIRGRFGSAWTVQQAAATAVAGFLLVVLAPSMPAGALLFGYVGMLAGPSVIGPFAEATSLRVALMLPVALALGIMVLGPRALRTAR